MPFYMRLGGLAERRPQSCIREQAQYRIREAFAVPLRHDQTCFTIQDCFGIAGMLSGDGWQSHGLSFDQGDREPFAVSIGRSHTGQTKEASTPQQVANLLARLISEE